MIKAIQNEVDLKTLWYLMDKVWDEISKEFYACSQKNFTRVWI